MDLALLQKIKQWKKNNKNILTQQIDLEIIEKFCKDLNLKLDYEDGYDAYLYIKNNDKEIYSDGHCSCNGWSFEEKPYTVNDFIMELIHE